MERKEPYASQEEFSKRVTHYADVPVVELRPGIELHIVSAERITVTFGTLAPGICSPPRTRTNHDSRGGWVRFHT